MSLRFEISIYTDGACSGNPGPGGWAAILKYGDSVKELSGGSPRTTNNRMEIFAAIAGLEALKKPCSVMLYSDSKYLVDAVNLRWVYSWQSKGWMRNNKDKAKNPDLWQRLLPLLDFHDVHFIWVKGHADNPFNNRCDFLAVSESKKFSGA